MDWPAKRLLARYWRPVRMVAGFVLLGLAVWVIVGKTSELSGAGAFLAQVRWYWLVLAGSVELASYLSMSSMQRLLLRAGETYARLRRVAPLTFAGNAVQSALPVGAAFAGLYYFRQYELMGADEVLAGWVVVSAALSSFATLAALAGIGLAMAASLGTTDNLVEAVLLVFVLAVAVALSWKTRTTLYHLAVRATTGLERLARKPPGQFTRPLARGIRRMRSVAPNPREWGVVLTWGAASWVFDLGCLLFSYLAVGAVVPWQGLLLAYCAGQLAVSMPITPGGLGVVEGSLMVALVAFGGAKAATVAAVLVYRVISFWFPLPVGGACYLALARMRKRLERPFFVAPALAPLPLRQAVGGALDNGHARQPGEIAPARPAAPQGKGRRGEGV